MYWFSCWCRYWGHSGVGLYSKVFGGWWGLGAYLCVFLRFLGLVVVYDYGCGEGSYLVAILAQWMTSMMGLRSNGCALLTPIHFKDFASPEEPRLCCNCVGCVDHVSGDE